MPPFEIQVFSPSRIASPPSIRAVVASAATSEPASGSDRAKAAMRVPATTPGSTRRLSASEPNSVTGPVPNPCMAKAKSARPSW